MFDKKIKMNVTDDESQLILFSLVELRNSLIKEGRYTDAVDDLILKLFS
ncbi:hypothetical protein [Aminicella lysinilytica]|uniref:Uncharacterized protein n=1 Tax=Aminicella lysinilytica TaxID=433323 RepID=A0A4R6PXM1_9FIRM|nr:hypothetical protein [Aminicella lysinilytica]TDP46655.1 hypothetical protein EV211_1561 [Aminicella lysinilytica]